MSLLISDLIKELEKYPNFYIEFAIFDPSNGDLKKKLQNINIDNWYIFKTINSKNEFTDTVVLGLTDNGKTKTT